MSQPSPYVVLARVFDEVRDMDAPLSVRLRLLADAVRQGSPGFADAVEALIA